MRFPSILCILAFILNECDSVKYVISSCIYSNNDNIVTFICSDHKNERPFHSVTTYHCDQGDFNKSDIKKVAFHNCELQHLPRELYEEYSGIQVLNITNLGLKWLYLEEAHSLVKLLASHNKLRTIPEYLGEIEEADLSYNEIDAIVSEDFKVSGFHLESEKIEQNLVTYKSLKYFTNDNKVKILNLSYNNFINLHVGIFTEFKELQHLNLSYNRIKGIEPLTLAYQIKLQTLDLSYNMLISLSNNIFGFQSNKLKSLLINGNNLMRVINGFIPANYPSLVIFNEENSSSTKIANKKEFRC